MSINPQLPPSYEELFNKIYISEISSSVSYSAESPQYENIPQSNSNISHSNRNIEPQPNRILPHSNRIPPHPNQNRTMSPPRDYCIWSLVNIFISSFLVLK